MCLIKLGARVLLDLVYWPQSRHDVNFFHVTTDLLPAYSDNSVESISLFVVCWTSSSHFCKASEVLCCESRDNKWLWDVTTGESSLPGAAIVSNRLSYAPQPRIFLDIFRFQCSLYTCRLCDRKEVLEDLTTSLILTQYPESNQHGLLPVPN
jgi:hypothetical protein